MAAAVGVDIVSLEKIDRALARGGQRLKNRLFTAREQAYCESRRRPAVHYGGRFAAKEAFLKALEQASRGGIAWREIEILAESGRPVCRPAGRALAALGPARRAKISISHSGGYAVAVCLIEG